MEQNDLVEIITRALDVFTWKPYSERNVDCTKWEDWVVDTSYCQDIDMFETAIQNSFTQSWVIVERYADKEKAKGGHIKWVERCKENPKQVYDVQTHEVVNVR